MSAKRTHAIIKDTALYSAANFFSQIIGIFTSILLRKFLGPVYIGIWSLAQVLLGYCGYASFGTTKALMRDYPCLLAKGENQNAEKLKNVILTFSMIASIIPMVLLLGYTCLKWLQLSPALRNTLLFISFFLFIQRFYDVLMALLRSEKRFVLLSKLLVVNAAGMLLVALIFVPFWGFYGLLLGSALILLACMAVVYWDHVYCFLYSWDSKVLSSELRLGIPLLVSGFLGELLRSADKWVITKELGFYELGLYSLAMMANTYVFSLPMMFAHVWYPNLQEVYGKKQNAQDVANYLLKPVAVISVLCPFLAGIAIFILPVVIELVLPKFLPGLLPMKIYLFGTLFVLLAQFSLNFLITLDHCWIGIPLALMGILCNVGGALFLLHQGYGLTGVAISSSGAFAIYGLTAYAVALRQFASFKQALYKIAELASLSMVFFVIIYTIDWLVQMDRRWAAAMLKLLIFSVFSLPFFLYLNKKTQVLSRIGEVLKNPFERPLASSGAEGS
jgi:O-antigen/teichoic acid export membrane protein